jgi:hypothetical protein
LISYPELRTYLNYWIATVTFPDGRSDTFTYYLNGKLETITENPVAGSGTTPRTWTFTWTGDELTLATARTGPPGNSSTTRRGLDT